VDVLESVSRVMIDIVDGEQRKRANDLLNIIATYRKAEDLVNIGAYVAGSSPEIDYAIRMIDRVNGYLKQDMNEKVGFEESRRQLYALFQ
jgi:flagellum-specific ATP synthase